MHGKRIQKHTRSNQARSGGAITGPGYCYYRRFSPIEGDALQFYIKPIRPVSPDVRNEGRSSQCLLKKIIVTCPFSPDQLLGNLEWVGVEQGLQLKRRIDHVIQFPQLAMMYARELLDIYEEFIN